MKRDELVKYLDERIGIRAMEDVSVNGLQVQGAPEVKRIALATDAAMAVYQKAAAATCDMVIAHHGLIWGGLRSITGRNYQHIRFLIENDINLYAAHLPLDAHPDLGNNASLAKVVGLQDLVPFGDYHGATIGFAGRLPVPLDREALASAWQAVLGGAPLILPFGKTSVETLGIVSGGGSSLLGEAIAEGLDCFVTGEGRHEDHHAAREAGVNVIYLGHYHSETLGVKAVGEDLAERFDLDVMFIDEPTII